MDEKELYEEYNVLPPPWGWVVLLVFSALIIGNALLLHALIKDRPREWYFGELPDTPAESIYASKEPPAEAPVPKQFPALPEAKPLPSEIKGQRGER